MPTLALTRTVTWDVKDRVASSPRVLLWDVDERVGKTSILLWNVLERIAKTGDVSWATLASAQTEQGESDPLTPCEHYQPIDNVFYRIYVDHLVRGNSRVFWELRDTFREEQPYTFQLQYSPTGNTAEATWEDVRSPVVDSFYAIDASQRIFGKQTTAYYRVKLTTNDSQIFYSNPQHILSHLTKRDWRIAREIIRKEKLRLRTYVGTEGYLLMARRSGTECSCVDLQTDEVTNDSCTTCYGTGFVGGYYEPLSCTFFDLSTYNRSETREIERRGTVDDLAATARYLGYPLIKSKDVFVSKINDMRYYVEGVGTQGHIKEVPIIVSLMLMRAPFSDIIYDFSISR